MYPQPQDVCVYVSYAFQELLFYENIAQTWAVKIVRNVYIFI
jgi:hypothetical protein